MSGCSAHCSLELQSGCGAGIMGRGLHQRLCPLRGIAHAHTCAHAHLVGAPRWPLCCSLVVSHMSFTWLVVTHMVLTYMLLRFHTSCSAGCTSYHLQCWGKRECHTLSTVLTPLAVLCSRKWTVTLGTAEDRITRFVSSIGETRGCGICYGVTGGHSPSVLFFLGLSLGFRICSDRFASEWDLGQLSLGKQTISSWHWAVLPLSLS